MPLGWERINVKQSTPNKNIVFIKPRPGPDVATSKDFLERLAAQCLPIMNKNYLAVVSLEEYQPNFEFWGRNFNNGEIIQLVLKSPSTGRWLPFKFVQLVLMHELAHCKEMNHSKAFWKVRNQYTDEMKVLWSQGYTGEGLWGRGVLLENGELAREELGEGEMLPEHMCGGTFKSRGRAKRKVKPKIPWKEAKERRIRRKFGENGVALGADDETKVKLEKGKKPIGKPRVAGSMRGRELRAAAALARLDVKKVEPEIKDEDLVTDSEESEFEEDVAIKPEPDDARDIDGSRLLDSQGYGMVKVCENEDKDDGDARREMEELKGIKIEPGTEIEVVPKQPKRPSQPAPSFSLNNLQVSNPTPNAKPAIRSKPPPKPTTRGNKQTKEVPKPSTTKPIITKSSAISKPHIPKPSPPIQAAETPGICPICTVENEKTALTCIACANVMAPEFVAGAWKCKSETCKDSKYINAGDVGLCGLCNARKSS